MHVNKASYTCGGMVSLKNLLCMQVRGAVVAWESAGLPIEGKVVQSHLPPFGNLGNFVHPTFACVFRKTKANVSFGRQRQMCLCEGK